MAAIGIVTDLGGSPRLACADLGDVAQPEVAKPGVLLEEADAAAEMATPCAWALAGPGHDRLRPTDAVGSTTASAASFILRPAPILPLPRIATCCFRIMMLPLDVPRPIRGCFIVDRGEERL